MSWKKSWHQIDLTTSDSIISSWTSSRFSVWAMLGEPWLKGSEFLGATKTCTQAADSKLRSNNSPFSSTTPDQLNSSLPSAPLVLLRCFGRTCPGRKAGWRAVYGLCFACGNFSGNSILQNVRDRSSTTKYCTTTGPYDYRCWLVVGIDACSRNSIVVPGHPALQVRMMSNKAEHVFVCFFLVIAEVPRSLTHVVISYYSYREIRTLRQKWFTHYTWAFFVDYSPPRCMDNPARIRFFSQVARPCTSWTGNGGTSRVCVSLMAD